MRKYIVILSVYILIYMIMFLSGNINCALGTDFTAQHLYFLDYIRNNLYFSHDLFPQLNMNLGLMQNMGTLYYHGLYNPYTLIAILLPFLNVVQVVFIIGIVIILLTLIFAEMLFNDYKVSEKNKTILLILIATMPVISYNLGLHLMYIYYIPFLFLNLVAINRFNKKSGKLMYIASFLGITYTNFFMLPVAFIISFIYWFIAIKNGFVKINKKLIINFVITNIVYLLLSAFYLIPQLFIFLQGSRSDFALDLYQTRSILTLAIDTKNIQSFSSPALYILFIYISYWLIKKRSYFILPIIFLLIEKNVHFINKVLNVFQYASDKVDIAFVAILFLVFAYFLQNATKKEIRNGIITTTIITIILCINHFIIKDVSYNILNIMNLSGIMIVYVIIYFKDKMNNTAILSILTVSCMLLFSFSAILYTDSETYWERFSEFNNTENFENYRTYNNVNMIYDMSSFGTSIYSSLENGNYYNLMNSELLEQSNNDRKREISNNPYTDYIFAIKNDNPTRPIMYGVDESIIYGSSELTNLTYLDKFLSQYSAVFIDGKTNISNFNGIQYENLLSIEELNVTSGEYTINQNLPDGLININFDFDTTLCSNNCVVSINESSNAMYKNTLNDNYNFYVDSSTGVLDVNVKEDMVIENLNIYYVNKEDIVNNLYDYTEPENFTVDINNSFDFDINMNDAGYIITSIPYDKGFNVYIDNQEVETLVANGYFLAAPIQSGEHHVKISYTIPGFKSGSILTIIGILLLGVYMYVYKGDGK